VEGEGPFRNGCCERLTFNVYTADVVKSDTAVPESLKNALKEAVKPLEDVPDFHKDWHPGSDDKMLDLVHPSLFPLVYGRTRILPDSVTSLDDCIARCGEGVLLPVPSREGGDPDRWDGYSVKPPVVPGPYSLNFQWLPCDIDISGEDSVKYVVSPSSLSSPYRDAQSWCCLA